MGVNFLYEIGHWWLWKYFARLLQRIRLSREIISEICHVVLYTYHQVSNIRRTLVGNEIVDQSDVVGASPVGAAPTTSSLSI